MKANISGKGFKNPTKAGNGIIGSIVVLLLITLSAQGQVNPEIGQLKIQNFSSKSYKSHPQNWAISQDKKGLMYFGNNLGVLVYDGIEWELIKTENQTTVRSLDISPKGKVYVGASGDFGYLTSDDHGNLKYISLSKLYNLDEEKVGNIYRVNAFDQGVYFMTSSHIYFYNGRTLRLWESETTFQSAHSINGSYVVNQESIGLSKMVDDSLIPISNVIDFSDKKMFDVISYEGGELLALTEKNGFLRYKKARYNEEVNDDFLSRINNSIRYYSPDNGVYFKNHILSIGTWGNGVIFIDKEGDLIQHLNSSSGLIDEVITAQYVDNSGNLWLATSNGISRIAIDDNISAFREKVNLNETIEKIVRFNDELYVATHTGLFSWKETDKSGTFKRVAGITTECWDILPIQMEGKSVLLIAGNNAIYQLDEDLNLEQLVTCLPWTFHQLESDPSTVFVGLDDGLMCLKHEEGGWRIQNKVAGISNTIYSMAQSEDMRIWLGTLNNGVIRLDLRERITHYPYQFNTKSFDVENGLPEGGIFVGKYVGGVLFGTNDGIFSYDEGKNSFIEETVYKESMNRDHIVVHRLSEDPAGQLWTIGYWEDEFIVGFFKRNGSKPEWHEKSFKPISEEVFHSVYHENNGITWLGGPDGLFRYNMNVPSKATNRNFSVLIRKVFLNKDSIDFAGNINVPNYMDTAMTDLTNKIYPYEFNSMTFTFSSQYHKYAGMNLYSYQLEGFDEQWSVWSKDIKSVYTNLHEGNYTFKVKSKNVYGKESDIAEYSFIIKAPWYRTWWAFIIYFILSVCIVYSFVIIYTKKLKMIIKERTAEVVVQKEKIEKQKDEVEHQKKLLEIKNADITSSIKYAKRLQEALLPKTEQIAKYLKESFIWYKPKDIVSGDFYWMEHLNGIPGQDITLFATVDCTGHGVPGAFVSVVGNGGLNRAVNEFGLREPAAILDKLNEIVVDTLNKGDHELRDGMDISLCRFDFNKMEMQFAGANNPVYIIRKGIENMDHGLNGNSKFFKEDLCEIKANKQPVGYYEFSKNFINNSISLEKGDVIYLFSDGFTDQFGGPNCKKYNVSRFKNFLLSIYDQPMSAQENLIEREFKTWQGEEDQIDDVIVTGIRV